MSAAPKPNSEAVETSYRLLALISVCHLAARGLEDGGNSGIVASQIATCLSLAGDLANQVHDRIELAEREARS